MSRHHGVPRRMQGRPGAEPRCRRRVRRIGGRGVKPRPHSLTGSTYRMETPIGTAFITVNDTPAGDPFEVFVQVGKAGSDTMAVAEALGRLVSLVLRLPSPLSAQRRLEEVISQLSRIGGGQPTGFGAAKILSLPDALARTLAEHIGQARRATTGRRATPRPVFDASAISARSAVRPRSSTRKAARSASHAASTSASCSRADKGPSASLVPSAARSTYRKYASRASFGRRLAAGPFSPRSPGVCQRRLRTLTSKPDRSRHVLRRGLRRGDALVDELRDVSREAREPSRRGGGRDGGPTGR